MSQGIGMEYSLKSQEQKLKKVLIANVLYFRFSEVPSDVVGLNT